MAMMSACVLVRDEEKHFDRCIYNLHGLVDQIVIGVDSRSKDGTLDLAKAWAERNPPIECYVVKMDGFASARNYLADKASHDWIFVLDPDELMHEKDKPVIKRTMKNPQMESYWCGRYNFWKDIHHYRPDWYPDRQIRLYNKKHCRYRFKIHNQIYNIKDNSTVGTSGGNFLYHDVHVYHYGWCGSNEDIRGKHARQRYVATFDFSKCNPPLKEFEGTHPIDLARFGGI